MGDAATSTSAMADGDRVGDFIRQFTAHEAHLSAFAMSLVPNWADADDLMQQTNLVLWKKFDQFQLGTNFFSWASRILYLEAKEFRKKGLRSKLRFSDEFLATVAEEADDDAERLAERQRLLASCVEKLREPQRELLRMRYEDDGDLDRIAHAIGRSVKTVYNTLSQIRKALIDCVEREVERQASRGT